MSNTRDDEQYPYDREREAAAARAADQRTSGADQVERASCQHMVQSNGTCGNATCPNYGQS